MYTDIFSPLRGFGPAANVYRVCLRSTISCNHGNMLSVSSNEDVEPPRICAAINAAIEESGMRNRPIADAMGTSEVNVGRWRNRVEPSRDVVAQLEEVLGKPLGYINKIAGYVSYDDETDLLDLINKTHLLSDGYRRIVRRVVEEAIAGTQEERSEQSAWRQKHRPRAIDEP
jgi:hypothetical protein